MEVTAGAVGHHRIEAGFNEGQAGERYKGRKIGGTPLAASRGLAPAE